MTFWFMFWMWVASYVVGELLRPKPKVNNARPAGLGEFQFPTASEARPVPVVWGTVEISGPNLVWYGDLYFTPIIQTASSGKQSVSQITGYRYHVGMHFVLCHGRPDALLRIRANDKKAWEGEAMDEVIQVDARGLFGGEEGEGGLAGPVEVWSGAPDQEVSPFLEKHLSDVPAFRGVCSLIFKRFYVGTSTYLKPMKFLVRRLPTALGSGKEDIAGDANPAEMLYELLTEEVWGAGIPAAGIDSASFLAAANTLHTEAFGLSLLWDNRKTIEDMAGEILRHIDGLIYIDLRTGKLKLALARDDYEIVDLPVFDVSNCRLENFSRTAWDETVNEVRVTYMDVAAKSVDRTVAAQDLANWRAQGAVVSTQVQYPGVSNSDLALKLAQRDLKALAFPLAKGTIRVNRRAWDLAPGGVFNLDWEPLGIEQLIARVQRVRYGEPRRGEIDVDWVQDVFALSDSIYTDGGSSWEDPGSDPVDVSLVLLVEMPYLARLQLTTAPDDSCVPWIAAGQPSGDAFDYAIQASLNEAPYEYQGSGVWTPTGLLQSGIGQEDTSVLLVEEGINLETLTTPAQQDQGGGLFLLGDELIAYGSITDNGDETYTLNSCWRGMLDTTPAAHSAGDRAWFIAAGAGWTQDYYEITDDLDLKLLTRTGEGELSIDDATAHNIVFEGRAEMPYPPGNVTVNGVAYPTSVSGEITVTWSHRDRLQQTAYLVQQAAGSIGPEAGVTYTLRIYGELGGLVHTESGLTGTSYIYPEATEIAESGLGRLNNHLRIELEAVRDGVTSWQFQEREFDRV